MSTVFLSSASCSRIRTRGVNCNPFPRSPFLSHSLTHSHTQRHTHTHSLSSSLGVGGGQEAEVLLGVLLLDVALDHLVHDDVAVDGDLLLEDGGAGGAGDDAEARVDAQGASGKL